MTSPDKLKERAREAINKCKDRCYGYNGRDASNEVEGDYGTWKDWEKVLIKFAKSEIQAERSEIKRGIEEKINDNLGSGWSGKDSGECCSKCKMSNPVNPLQALVGCTNPFQIKEQYGQELCQCHIPVRKGVNIGLRKALEIIESRGGDGN